MAIFCGILDFVFWMGKYPSIKLQGERSFMSLRTWAFVLSISLCNMFISSWIVFIPVWIIHKEGYLRFGSNKALQVLFVPSSESIKLDEESLSNSSFLGDIHSYIVNKLQDVYEYPQFFHFWDSNEGKNTTTASFCNMTSMERHNIEYQQGNHYQGINNIQGSPNDLIAYYQFNIWTFLRNFIIHLFVIECWFYITHRILHYPPLYKSIHKIHHIYKAPTAIACIFAHPIEYCFGNVLGVILGPAISNCHPFECAFWMAFAIVSTCGSHSGYSFLGGEKHDLHHQYFDYNFGVSLFMDKLCGTEFENSKLWHRLQNKTNTIESNIKEKDKERRRLT